VSTAHNGAMPTIVRCIAHPPNPGFEPTEEQAWGLLHEVANEFGEYISAVIERPETGDEEAFILRRASVLFHQMVFEARDNDRKKD
jgi:hypothetical protein